MLWKAFARLAQLLAKSTKAPHEHQATSSLSEVKLEAALVLLLLLGGRLALALTEETARVDGGKNPLG